MRNNYKIVIIFIARVNNVKKYYNLSTYKNKSFAIRLYNIKRRVCMSSEIENLLNSKL